VSAPGSSILQKPITGPIRQYSDGIWGPAGPPPNIPDGFCNIDSYRNKVMDPGHWICFDRKDDPWNYVPYRRDLYYQACQDCEFSLANANPPWKSLFDIQTMCQGWPSTCTQNGNPASCTKWFTVPPNPNPALDASDNTFLYIALGIGFLLAVGYIAL
jgi:hypothetical protein